VCEPPHPLPGALPEAFPRRQVRAGDDLLKQEDAEMEKIASLAQALLDSESRTPSPPLSCDKERAACVACYQQNVSADCRSYVDAFARCANEALKVCVRGRQLASHLSLSVALCPAAFG
jgi:hypothetical protein